VWIGLLPVAGPVVAGAAALLVGAGSTVALYSLFKAYFGKPITAAVENAYRKLGVSKNTSNDEVNVAYRDKSANTEMHSEEWHSIQVAQELIRQHRMGS